MPFYVYEFERTSGYAVPPHVIEELRSAAPNLAGMKVSDSPWERFQPYLIEGLDVFVGPELLIQQGIAAGAVGAVSALATAFPELVLDAVRTKRVEASRRVGELRAAIEAFPRHAALKHVLRARGRRDQPGCAAPASRPDRRRVRPARRAAPCVGRAARRSLGWQRLGPKNSPSRFRFRPPFPPAFGFRLLPPGWASVYLRSVLGARGRLGLEGRVRKGSESETFRNLRQANLLPVLATSDQKFAEPVSLSSTLPTGLRLPPSAARMGFDLLALRARRKKETRVLTAPDARAPRNEISRILRTPAGLDSGRSSPPRGRSARGTGEEEEEQHRPPRRSSPPPRCAGPGARRCPTGAARARRTCRSDGRAAIEEPETAMRRRTPPPVDGLAPQPSRCGASWNTGHQRTMPAAR